MFQFLSLWAGLLLLTGMVGIRAILSPANKLACQWGFNESVWAFFGCLLIIMLGFSLSGAALVTLIGASNGQ